MENNVLPYSIPEDVNSEYLTSKLVSNIASECVDNMHSFFMACKLGGMDFEKNRKEGGMGPEYRLPIGISDYSAVYTLESFLFKFEKDNVCKRDIKLEGIVGSLFQQDKEYFKNGIVRPLIVSLINEASSRQFVKFLNNGIIYAENAINIFSRITNTIRLSTTPSIPANLNTTPMILSGAEFGNSQAQLLHNQTINSLSLLGMSRLSAVANVDSGKALSGMASTNAETNNDRYLNKILDNFVIINQNTQHIPSMRDMYVPSSFLYADVVGSLDGPISLISVVEYLPSDDDANVIDKIKVQINQSAVKILQAVLPPEMLSGLMVSFMVNEPLSICGPNAPFYINRADGYGEKWSTYELAKTTGCTVVVSEFKTISISDKGSVVVPISPLRMQPKEEVVDTNNMGSYAPVIRFGKTKTSQNTSFDSLYSYSCPILQQNCPSDKKIGQFPWIVCDPLVIMSSNTPYQYVMLDPIKGIENEDIDSHMAGDEEHGHKMGVKCYSQGSVITSSNQYSMQLMVDVGLNNKTYTIGMIPRIVNYYDYNLINSAPVELKKSKQINKE